MHQPSSTSPRGTRRVPWLALPIAMLAACAEGGGSETLGGDLTLAADHHIYSLRAVNRFDAFPVTAQDQAFTTVGTLSLLENSTYTVTTAGGTSSPANYFLQSNGQFDLISRGNFNAPNTVLTGGYGLDGNTDHFAFVDRSITSNSLSLGLYFGTRHLEVIPDLEATDWHLLSLHLLFPGSAPLNPDNVARAAWGSLRAENTDGNPGQELLGTGRDSAGADLDFGGSLAALNTIGEVNLRVDYSPTSGPQVGSTDPRNFAAAVGFDADGSRVIFGLDGDPATGEMGLLALVEKRTGTIDLRDLAGSYEASVLTFFVDPSLANVSRPSDGINSGTDAAAGILTISEAGAFRFAMEGAGGADFTYTGTVTAADDGLLTFSVNDGQNGNWQGAVDQAAKTMVVLDGTVENIGPPNGIANLNMFICLRKPE